VGAPIKVPWGPSCDVDDEGGKGIEAMSCQQLLAWLRALRKHLQGVIEELDRLIDDWPLICRGKGESMMKIYLEHIWKIEQLLLCWPPMGSRRR